MRGENRQKAIELGKKTEYNRLALMMVSVLHLSHWRLDVTVTNCVTLGFGTRKGFGCAEICPVITEVIPAQKGE